MIKNWLICFHDTLILSAYPFSPAHIFLIFYAKNTYPKMCYYCICGTNWTRRENQHSVAGYIQPRSKWLSKLLLVNLRRWDTKVIVINVGLLKRYNYLANIFGRGYRYSQVLTRPTFWIWSRIQRTVENRETREANIRFFIVVDLCSDLFFFSGNNATDLEIPVSENILSIVWGWACGYALHLPNGKLKKRHLLCRNSGALI